MADTGEKTFEPTDQRREKFRKEGRWARAKDVGGLAATAAVVASLIASRHALVAGFEVLFRRSMGDLDAVERLGAMGAFRSAALPVLLDAFPVVGLAAVLALGASAAQSRFRLNTDVLSPKFEKLDPKAGLERLFSFRKNLADLAISLVRVFAVGAVGSYAVKRELSVLLSMAHATVLSSAETAGAAVARVVGSILGALAIVACADYAYSWFSLERDMRMTRQERIDEQKQQDGDPKAKGRMKARARALAKKRALASVKGADVIVTNPTHVAVALRYGPKDPAPIVVAKGVDEVALRIRAEGRKFGIPILENRPLARALNAEVTVGRMVPQAHFAAVAQVLAFVYKLKKRGALR
ncbi:Flagellar biosynthesis protein FlhB [Labilithrix luteola]|uniref:Flagellar biosynthesis protein FlhB n=1 Tax=Labilithrix luteola TaxID=1391654 RepID=A0A0K1PMV7_9BACT|nr:EscU/YscU/HrcU family type III secretion system export apparatus switch protein [Labilithrix luteola]AKU94721.1 Flagellar biosynthesis protein FlhB [Labilithrix luteola]